MISDGTSDGYPSIAKTVMAIKAARHPHLGKEKLRNLKKIEQIPIPPSFVDVVKERPTRDRFIGNKDALLREVPQEIAVQGGEGSSSFLDLSRDMRIMAKEPEEFGPSVMTCQGKPCLGVDRLPLILKVVAEVLGSEVLPGDDGGERFTTVPVPEKKRRTLACETHAQDIVTIA